MAATLIMAATGRYRTSPSKDANNNGLPLKISTCFWHVFSLFVRSKLRISFVTKDLVAFEGYDSPVDDRSVGRTGGLDQRHVGGGTVVVWW